MKLVKLLALGVISGAVVACSSGGPIKTGPDTYYLTKKSAGGGFVNGDSTKASLLREADTFCSRQGKEVQVVDAESHRGIPFAKIANAEVTFKCLAPARG